jgi:hypothetical protein
VGYVLLCLARKPESISYTFEALLSNTPAFEKESVWKPGRVHRRSFQKVRRPTAAGERIGDASLSAAIIKELKVFRLLPRMMA